MSASREKKARKEDVGTELSAQERETKKRKTKTIVMAAIVFLVVALIIGSIVLLKGPYFRSRSVAATVGDHEVTPAVLRYFYVDHFNTFAQQYSSIMSTLFSATASIDEQVYDTQTGQTWGELMMEETLDEMRDVYAAYDEAMANGYEMTADDETALNSVETSFTLYAGINKMDLDSYVETVYGNGSDYDSFLEYYRIRVIASSYDETVYNSFSYTPEQLAAADAESPDDYNYYTYHVYVMNVSQDASEEEVSAMRQEAEAMAEESKGDLDRFLELCGEKSGSENYANGTVTLRKDYTKESLSASIQEWITDPARQEGDTTAIQSTDTSSYVLYYVSSTDNNYDAVNVRLIQIDASENDDGSYDWDAADEKLSSAMQEFEESDGDGEAFGKIVGSYTSVQDDIYTGGLHEYVHHGDYSDQCESWLFDAARQPGDTIAIQDEGAYYYFYFEGSAGNYRDYLIDSALRTKDYQAWTDGLGDTVSLQTNEFGLNRMLKTLSYNPSNYQNSLG